MLGFWSYDLIQGPAESLISGEHSSRWSYNNSFQPTKPLVTPRAGHRPRQPNSQLKLTLPLPKPPSPHLGCARSALADFAGKHTLIQ